jgi:hypothetical protein
MIPRVVELSTRGTRSDNRTEVLHVTRLSTRVTGIYHVASFPLVIGCGTVETEIIVYPPLLLHFADTILWTALIFHDAEQPEQEQNP